MGRIELESRLIFFFILISSRSIPYFLWFIDLPWWSMFFFQVWTSLQWQRRRNCRMLMQVRLTFPSSRIRKFVWIIQFPYPFLIPWWNLFVVLSLPHSLFWSSFLSETVSIWPLMATRVSVSPLFHLLSQSHSIEWNSFASHCFLVRFWTLCSYLFIFLPFLSLCFSPPFSPLDRNECLAALSPCDPVHEDCINSHGGYYCKERLTPAIHSTPPPPEKMRDTGRSIQRAGRLRKTGVRPRVKILEDDVTRDLKPEDSRRIQSDGIACPVGWRAEGGRCTGRNEQWMHALTLSLTLWVID